MIGLYDFDSMIYASTYRIVDIEKIKEWFDAGRTKDWMTKEIVQLAVNRLLNTSVQVLNAVEETGITIEETEYYITACRESERKKRYPEYKSGRRKKVAPLRKWVNLVRTYIHDEMNFVGKSMKWEADDLVHDRAIEIGYEKCIVISIDKDLRQIAGLHFDINKVVAKDEFGNIVLDNFGNPLKEYKGLDIVTPKEAEFNFWSQVISGDSGDSIPGSFSFGVKKAQDLIREGQELGSSLEDIAKEAYYTAEMKKLKRELNSSDPKFKKLSFKKYREDLETVNPLCVDLDELKEKSLKEYELNYFLIKLGTKR